MSENIKVALGRLAVMRTSAPHLFESANRDNPVPGTSLLWSDLDALGRAAEDVARIISLDNRLLKERKERIEELEQERRSMERACELYDKGEVEAHAAIATVEYILDRAGAEK